MTPSRRTDRTPLIFPLMALAALATLTTPAGRALAAAAPACHTAALTGEGVNLRKAPRLDAPRAAQGRRGETFRVEAAEGDWARVLDGPHAGRFVHQRFLSLSFAEAPECARTEGPGQVRGSRVKVRAKPDAAAAVTGQAFQGDPLTVAPGPKPWLRIVWPESWQDRYIHGDFVELVLPAAPDAQEEAEADAARP